MNPDERNTTKEVVRQFCAAMSDSMQSEIGTCEFDFAKAFSEIGEQSSKKSETALQQKEIVIKTQPITNATNASQNDDPRRGIFAFLMYIRRYLVLPPFFHI